MQTSQLTQQQWCAASYLNQLLCQPVKQFFSLRESGTITLFDQCEQVTSAQHLVATAEVLNFHQCWLLQQALVDEGVSVQHFAATPYAQQTGGGVCLQLGNDSRLSESQLNRLSSALQLDLALLIDKRPRLREPGLLVMDMDSTLIKMECIDQMAILAGVGEQVASVTEQAMQGELDFAESLKARVQCLTGASQSILRQARQQLPFMPGVFELTRVLQQHHWKLVVASGGFLYFADYVRDSLGLDAAIANDLQIENGLLTGKLKGDIVDASTKAKVLSMFAEKWQIPNSQCVALGDGANDLEMMGSASLGVAFHAKPKVKQLADCSICLGGLHVLLHYLS